MELDKLIEELESLAVSDRIRYLRDTGLIRKAAEVIKLLRECINEESNEKWRRGIDEVMK